MGKSMDSQGSTATLDPPPGYVPESDFNALRAQIAAQDAQIAALAKRMGASITAAPAKAEPVETLDSVCREWLDTPSGDCEFVKLDQFGPAPTTARIVADVPPQFNSNNEVTAPGRDGVKLTFRPQALPWLREFCDFEIAVADLTENANVAVTEEDWNTGRVSPNVVPRPGQYSLEDLLARINGDPARGYKQLDLLKKRVAIPMKDFKAKLRRSLSAYMEAVKAGDATPQELANLRHKNRIGRSDMRLPSLPNPGSCEEAKEDKAILAEAAKSIRTKAK